MKRILQLSHFSILGVVTVVYESQSAVDCLKVVLQMFWIGENLNFFDATSRHKLHQKELRLKDLKVVKEIATEKSVKLAK